MDLEKMTSRDRSLEEKNVLLCVAKGRQSLGRSLIIEVLRASHSVRVFSRRLYINSTFGALRDHSMEEVDEMIQGLVDDGLLAATEDEYPRLTLTEAGKAALHEYAEELDGGDMG